MRPSCPAALALTWARAPSAVITPASTGWPAEITAPTMRVDCPGALRKPGPGPASASNLSCRGWPGVGGGGGGRSEIAAECRAASATWLSSWFIKKRCSANSVATPMPAHTTANKAIWVTSRRARSDHVRGERLRVGWRACRRSARGLEDIPGPAQGVDHRFAPAVDLLPQIGDIQLDDVGPAAEVVAPHPVEDLGLAQHPLRVAHHEPQ